MNKRLVHLHIIRYLSYLGKQLTSKLGRVYNPLNKLVRRVRRIMKESYSYLFVLAVASILAILAVVAQPLFAPPFNWSNINLLNLEVVLSRFIYALPFIALFLLATIFIIKQIKKIDEEKDTKLAEKLAEKLAVTLTKAFKEALREDREEQRKEAINKAGEW